MQHYIPVSHSKVEFCGVQKQRVKLVFSKSGFFFHIWHTVSSVAQGQNVVNVHKLACRQYEIHVIKNSVSPEKRKMDFFFQIFPKS